MALGNLFKSLFAGSSGESQAQASDPIDYKGFTIEAAPLDEDGKYRIAGYISGDLNGEIKRVQFIRADQTGDKQGAIDHSITKARQIIDELGTNLLQKSQL
jgi:hypothetical protein